MKPVASKPWGRMIRSSVLLVASTLGLASGTRAVATTTDPVAPFVDGDRWCAIGDSITQGGNYHAFVHLFYATRFPTRRIELFNCGISGDTSYGVEARLDRDVLVHKPTVASIMLGMNDVGRDLYKPDLNKPNLEEERQRNITNSIKHVKTIVEKLQSAGIRVILITPSIYDDTSTMSSPNNKGVNAALEKYGVEVKALASSAKVGLVDFHALMNEVNAQMQKADPAATLIGNDRVHPHDPGHFVMAYAFLKAQGMPKYVSRIEIDAAGAKTGELVGCQVNDLKTTADGVNFSCMEDALPYPAPAEMKSLVPFVQELDQEVLCVKGLTEGRYELQIDGQPVKTWTSVELAEGVNLAEETSTPQYKQASAVAKLSHERANIYASHLRIIAWLETGILAKVKLDETNPAALRASVEAAVEAKKDTPYYNYYKSQSEVYLKFKPKQAEDQATISRLLDEIYQKNHPSKHEFSLKRAG